MGFKEQFDFSKGEQLAIVLLLIVLLASIYPAVKARRGRPAELLRS